MEEREVLTGAMWLDGPSAGCDRLANLAAEGVTTLQAVEAAVAAYRKEREWVVNAMAANGWTFYQAMASLVSDRGRGR